MSDIEFDNEEELEDEDEGDTVSGINITPLVDVALTLVLVFMVTMPLSMIHAITVRRQIVEKYGLSTPQENVQIKLSGQGIFVKDKKGKNRHVANQDLGFVLTQMIQDSSRKRVLLECERNVTHGQTVWVMDMAKQSGAQDISFIGG